MNARGFNLFTAIVSFLLITLTVLLMQSMIQSERMAADMLKNAEARRDIEAVADNAVADAMQTFNYSLRHSLAKYVTDTVGGTRNSFSLPLGNTTWNDTVKNFVESKFGTGTSNVTSFASDMTSEIGYYFSGSSSGITKAYTITLQRDALNDCFKQSIITAIGNAGNNFFEVVGCKNGNPWDCPLGTFYVNLPIAGLAPEDYECMPKVTVVNAATKEQISQVILPRANFKIYVPLRLFKAIAEARGLAHFSETGNLDIDTQIMGQPGIDAGLFGEKEEAKINSLLLGMCDAGSCAPRISPCERQLQTEWFTSGCPGDNFLDPAYIRVDLEQTYPTTCVLQTPAPARYDAAYSRSNANLPSGNEVLQRLVKNEICGIAETARDKLYFATDPLFAPVSGADPECPLLESASARAESIQTKSLVLEGSTQPQVQTSSCAKITSASATVAFTDNNPSYRIEKDVALTYSITLDPGYSGTLPGNPQPGTDGWKCVSKKSSAGNFGTPKPIECLLPSPGQ